MIFSRKPEGEIYWISLRVDLTEPLPIQSDGSEGESVVVVGFFQNFGVTAASPQAALEAASREATLGRNAGLVSEPRVTAVDPSSLETEVRQRSGDWTRAGIWYRSGRAFFPSETDA